MKEITEEKNDKTNEYIRESVKEGDWMEPIEEAAFKLLSAVEELCEVKRLARKVRKGGQTLLQAEGESVWCYFSSCHRISKPSVLNWVKFAYGVYIKFVRGNCSIRVLA